MPDELKAIWSELAGRYTRDQILADGLFEEIHKKYNSPSRYYHNLQHICELLQLSRQYDQYLQDKDAVYFSIFYHDIIYNVLRKDNEPRSAALAVKRLALLGVPAGRQERISEFIKATQTHIIPGTAENTTDLSFFLDFDMVILAAPWEQYLVYTRQVRKEYRIYPDLIYRSGRKAFLQKTLQSPHIFQTTLLRDQYEAQARANMERELFSELQ